MPIAYIPRTRQRYADYSPYRWVLNHDAPWAPLKKPLRDCKLALVSSGGFYLEGQAPPTDADTPCCRIPKDVDLAELRIAHHGYRDNDADHDPNIVLPIEHLHELETAGVIGAFAEWVLSFPTIYSQDKTCRVIAPHVVEELKAMGTEAALLVPV